MSRSEKHPRLTRAYLNKAHPGNRFDIGDHTYGHPNIQEPHSAPLKIGKYCSIADRVTIILANHRTDLTTTYPFFSLHFLWPEAASLGPDHDWPGPVEIGSDIWIGFGASILPGIRVGHGAIIAANANVTKDVPPYAIVGGNPARVIRKRYDEATIERLLAIAWWDWDDEQVAQALPLLMQPSITAFLDFAGQRTPARQDV
ncbi:MAG TPA: CatB-related O-acetyltransferase [Acetobacteraceae bacterium]|nr:CatB-related O-acetyltransferase [Acetobacteraceae bacterium]